MTKIRDISHRTHGLWSTQLCIVCSAPEYMYTGNLRHREDEHFLYQRKSRNPHGEEAW
jgi:hypothetical protein